jgi:CBS domain-containing protein
MSLKHFVRNKEPLLLMAESETAGDTIDQMIDGHFGAALVMSSENTLVGIFTERDVLTKIVRPGLDPAVVLVSEVMTTDVVTIEEEQSLDAAIHCIQAYQVSHLPIISVEKRVVGILTIRRLLHDKIKDLLDGLQNLEAYFNDSSGG